MRKTKSYFINKILEIKPESKLGVLWRKEVKELKRYLRQLKGEQNDRKRNCVSN